MLITFKCHASGVSYKATYEIEGRHIAVRSAYGSKRVPLGLFRPKKLAKMLLRVLLREAAARTPPVAGRISSEPKCRVLH